MKRSSQEIIELIVFTLIALTVGTGLMWILSQLFGILAVVLGFLSAVIWFLLRFLIPIAIVSALIYFAINALLLKSTKASVNNLEPVTKMAEEPEEDNLKVDSKETDTQGNIG